MSKGLKWIWITLCTVAVFVGIWFLYDILKENYSPQIAPEPNQTETGEIDYSAPDFTALDENGNPVKLSDYFGKPIVLNFWATWCYYCKEEMPDFDAAYRNNPDIQFLMVNVTDGSRETMEIAKDYVSQNDFVFPVLFDTNLDAASTYGATGLPMTVFITRDGKLFTYASGMLSAENLKKGIDLIR